MKKYILFDLDGTLTESAPGIINSLKYALEKLGIADYDEEILKKFIGPPLAVSFKEFFGFDETGCLRAIDCYREYFSVKGLFENNVYDGVHETLSSLKNSGLKLAVATSKPEVFTKRIIDKFRLTEYFDVICGIPLDNEKMAKSEVISRTLKELGVIDKSEAVMVGDRFYDIDGAHENGIECVGVTYGYGSERELKEAGADWIVHSALELTDMFKEVDR